MAKLSRKHLQQFLRNNMTYDEYNFNQLFMLYSEILGRDGMLEYEPMSSYSFKRLTSQWAHVEGGWLIIERGESVPKYYKRCLHRNKLSRKKLHDVALCLLNRGKALWPR